MKNTASAYENYLRNHLTRYNFPEADDESFIIARAENAYDVFCDARLRGLDVATSQELAHATLMQDIDLSLDLFVRNILDVDLPDRVPESIYPLIIADMAEVLAPYEDVPLETYATIKGEEMLVTLRYELIEVIDEYLTKNGL